MVWLDPGLNPGLPGHWQTSLSKMKNPVPHKKGIFSVCHETAVMEIWEYTKLWLRCGTRPYERRTQWNSNSLVKVCSSSLLTISLPEAPWPEEWRGPICCHNSLVHSAPVWQCLWGSHIIIIIIIIISCW